MELSSNWSFYTGNRLSFGRGAVQAFRHILPGLGTPNVLVITDSVLRNAGILDTVLDPIRSTGCQVTVFDEGQVEPSTDLAVRAADAARSSDAEVLVGLGGGSNMDLAKMASVLLAHEVSPVELFDFDAVPGPTAPLICVPTTAGTGSEVSHAAVLKNADNGRKAAVLSQAIRPAIAVVDPSLTDSCPAVVTAASGIDALTHAIEAYLATSSTQFEEDYAHGLPYEGNHPLGDLYAEKAIQLIGQHLREAVHNPGNPQARDGMALAATLAGVAFSNCGVTLAHALEYWIGAKYDCSHGAGNGIVLPEVMRFTLPNRPERLVKIAGLLSGNEPAEHEPEDAFDIVVRLRRDIGLPEKLSQIGAKVEDLKKLSRSAMTLKRLIELTPRPTTHHDLLGILEACF